MIEIIPAIDLIGGKCVRLVKGDYAQKKEYGADPVDCARRFADCGVRRIHVVDLDGAKESTPRNLATLEKIASAVPVEIEWGGGISGTDALESVFNAGATQAIIGSVAALKPELFAGWLESCGGDALVLGADVRNRKIAVKGWLEDTEVTVDELVESFLGAGLKQVLCTDISRDGMLQGPSMALYTDLQAKFPQLIFTVSGGISCMDDIRALNEAGLRRVIVGKAWYEGRISAKEIEQWSLNA